MYKHWEPVGLANFPGEKTIQLKLKRVKEPNQIDVIYFYKDDLFHLESTDGTNRLEIEITFQEYEELFEIIKDAKNEEKSFRENDNETT